MRPVVLAPRRRSARPWSTAWRRVPPLSERATPMRRVAEVDADSPQATTRRPWPGPGRGPRRSRPGPGRRPRPGPGALPPPPPTVLAASAMSSPACRPLSGVTAATRADAAAVGLADEHDRPDAVLVADADGEVAQPVAVQAVDPGHDDAVDAPGGQLAGLAGGRLALERLDLVAQGLELGQALLDAGDQLVGGDAQPVGGARPAGPRPAEAVDGPRPVTASMRRRFEPIEPSDTIFIGPMSPSARTWVPPQNSIECGAGLEHPHEVAVLVAEEGDGAQRLGRRPWWSRCAAPRRWRGSPGWPGPRSRRSARR